MLVNSLKMESNGPGVETLRHLKELGCSFLFRELADVAQAQFMLDATFGVDVNVRTKATIISVLQGLIRRRQTGERAIVVRSEQTLNELESYVQTPTQSGLSFRMGGEGVSNDDCVMCLGLGTFVGTAYPIFNYEKARQVAEYKKQSADPLTNSFWAWQKAEREKLKRIRRRGY